MTTLAVVGAQWGDEGKGKVVDALAERAEIVARWSGGNNAGHTLVVDGRKIVTHLVPSGCAYPGTLCVLGAGMVIDIDVLADEIASLRAMGLLGQDELRVSLDAHVILPHHRAIDGLREDAARPGQRIGTTRRGIGPAYEAKAGRRGVRVRDVLDPRDLASRLELEFATAGAEIARLGGTEVLDPVALEPTLARWRALLSPLACDTADLLETAITSGRRVLLEGAQGALLDLDHGTYPFVTSSNTIAGGACTGLGIGPTRIGQVWGITKAYATRVGAGPFPTRLDDEDGEALRRLGAEFGATTGRPRDCGWLDLPALRHAARRNGMTGLCVTKLDVLAGMPRAMVCTGYKDGVVPGRDPLERAEPVLEAIAGWDRPDLSGQVARARTLDALPAAVRRYLDAIEEAVGVPITLVSTGAERGQTIFVRSAFD